MIQNRSDGVVPVLQNDDSAYGVDQIRRAPRPRLSWAVRGITALGFV